MEVVLEMVIRMGPTMEELWYYASHPRWHQLINQPCLSTGVHL